jgi:hypothetical protein
MPLDQEILVMDRHEDHTERKSARIAAKRVAQVVSQLSDDDEEDTLIHEEEEPLEKRKRGRPRKLDSRLPQSRHKARHVTLHGASVAMPVVHKELGDYALTSGNDFSGGLQCALAGIGAMERGRQVQVDALQKDYRVMMQLLADQSTEHKDVYTYLAWSFNKESDTPPPPLSTESKQLVQACLYRLMSDLVEHGCQHERKYVTLKFHKLVDKFANQGTSNVSIINPLCVFNDLIHVLDHEG